MPSLSVIFVRPRYANAKGQAFLPVNSRGSHILCLVHRWEDHYQDLSLGGNTLAWALRSLNISTQTKHFGLESSPPPLIGLRAKALLLPSEYKFPPFCTIGCSFPKALSNRRINGCFDKVAFLSSGQFFLKKCH